MGFAIGSSKDQELAIGGVKVGGFAIGSTKVWSQGKTKQLYMVGTSGSTRGLWISSTTGLTRIGSSVGFGYQDSIGENLPLGIEYFNGVLYMLGGRFDALFSLNTDTGVATRIGTADIASQLPTDLTAHNGKLYMVENDSDSLWTLDVSDASRTLVGRINHSNVTGIASHNGSVYMVGDSPDALYSLDVNTARATRIGSTDRFGANIHSPEVLVSHNGELLMAGTTGSHDSIYSLNTDTGVATRTRYRSVTLVGGLASF